MAHYDYVYQLDKEKVFVDPPNKKRSSNPSNRKIPSSIDEIFKTKFSKSLQNPPEHHINKSAEENKPALPTIKEIPISIVDKDGIIIASFINEYFAKKFLHCVEGDYQIKQ